MSASDLWPRIPSGQPGSIANKVYSKVAQTNRRKETREQRHDYGGYKVSRDNNNRKVSRYRQETDNKKSHSRRRSLDSTSENGDLRSPSRKDHHQNRLQRNLSDYLEDQGKFHGAKK